MDNNSILTAVKIQGEESSDSSDDDQTSPDAKSSAVAVAMGIIGQISANPKAAVSLVEGLIERNHVVQMDNGSSVTCGVD